ncbi:MAG: MEDS domain-containing protein [Acidobacteria bacterium]|nr:MEDS domain-containing protein [Acidobacteriota bacterium]
MNNTTERKADYRDDLEPVPSGSDFWHSLQLYEDDEFLADAVAYFVRRGLEAGDGVVIIGSAAHRKAIDDILQGQSVEADKAKVSGQYVSLDAAEVLAQFMVDGWPDEGRFQTVMGKILQSMAAGGKCPCRRVFGEMVAILWVNGQPEAALQLEKLWNQLSASHDFSLLCGYPLRAVHGNGRAKYVLRLCAAHSQVAPVEATAKRA